MQRIEALATTASPMPASLLRRSAVRLAEELDLRFEPVARRWWEWRRPVAMRLTADSEARLRRWAHGQRLAFSPSIGHIQWRGWPTRTR
jgi:hypothetical protein